MNEALKLAEESLSNYPSLVNCLLRLTLHRAQS